jgi:hypothetical protein
MPAGSWKACNLTLQVQEDFTSIFTTSSLPGVGLSSIFHAGHSRARICPTIEGAGSHPFQKAHCKLIIEARHMFRTITTTLLQALAILATAQLLWLLLVYFVLHDPFDLAPLFILLRYPLPNFVAAARRHNDLLDAACFLPSHCAAGPTAQLRNDAGTGVLPCPVRLPICHAISLFAECM